MNREFAKALLDVQAPTGSLGLRSWNGSDPATRFAVHRNNVLVSLVDALASTFPVCMQLVGEEFFRAMAREFARACPPTSPLMHEYGATFPDFVLRFPPAASLPYLSDVARLEWLRVDSYHAADASAVHASRLEGLLAEPERLLALRLQLHPACRHAAFDHAAFSVWAAHQAPATQTDFVVEPGEDVLVARPDLDVQVVLLTPGGDQFLRALGQGSSLGTAAAEASAIAGFDLAANVRVLLQYELIVELG